MVLPVPGSPLTRRALESDGSVDRDTKILRRDVSIGALETPHPDYFLRAWIASRAQ
jgi:hypothetical protein